MATAPTTQQSAVQTAQAQLKSLQSQMNSAAQNMNVKAWGGSSADQANWQATFQTLYGRYTALKNNMPLFQQVDQYNLAGNPQIQQAMNQYLQAPDVVGGTNLLTQALNQNIQLAQQQQELTGLQNNLTAQDFGNPNAQESAAGQNANIGDALTNNQGLLGQLNQFETNQTASAFNNLLSPEISMSLGGQGLANSGANVELQSKALAGLQLAQQQSIENAGLGMESNLQGLQTSSTMGNIGTEQQNLANLQQTTNFNTTMQFQQSLMNQQAQLAQQLAQYGGAGSGGLGSLVGGIAGAGLGAFVGGPAGAMAGYGLGSSLGGSIGNTVNPGTSGQGTGGMGSNFFAASSSMPKTWGFIQPPGMSGTGNGQGLNLTRF